MANVVTFLKNYHRFAWSIRLTTSKTYLNTFQQTIDEQEKKIMMLRITDELIASTEDLAMWIAAIEVKDRPTKQYRDVWEYMLQVQAEDKQVVKILKNWGRVKTANGLIKKLKLSSLPKIAVAAKTDEKTITEIIDVILKAIKESKHNRLAKKGILLRFHNKVKHGMMIQDYKHELFIRDLRTKINKKTNRVTRRNSNLYLEINIERARKMIKTIEVNSYAINGLISLLLYDFIDKFQNNKRRLTKKQKSFLIEVLKD